MSAPWLVAALLAAAPPVVQDAPPAAAGNPRLLNSADDLRIVCGERRDVATQLVCVSWLNAASQVNFRYRTLNPVMFPDFCPPSDGVPIGRQRELVLAWLAAHPVERQSPALLAYRTALAAAFPCKAG